MDSGFDWEMTHADDTKEQDKPIENIEKEAVIEKE